jgi:hypothetical protein
VYIDLIGGGVMAINYFEPLSRGMSRMNRDLFHPFDLRRWFVVGFTAFLAALADTGVSGPPALEIRKRSNAQLEDILYFPQRAREWLGDNPGWAIAIAFGLFFLVVIALVITWLSARGKFMFLDNIVRSQARVAAPWYEYRREGNSFFWWNLLWLIVFTAIALTFIFFCFVNLQAVYESTRDGRALILPAVLAGLGFFAISVLSAFAFLLLRDFVIPIMYRDRIGGWQALEKFLPLFFSQLHYFIGYGLFRFCLMLVIVIGIVIIGCVTCCVGFVILSIPYVNAVALLPISYALRSFSVEFLEQFGPEYRIFPRQDLNPPGAQPASV